MLTKTTRFLPLS